MALTLAIMGHGPTTRTGARRDSRLGNPCGLSLPLRRALARCGRWLGWGRSVLRALRLPDYGNPARHKGRPGVLPHVLRAPLAADLSDLLPLHRGLSAAGAVRRVATGARLVPRVSRISGRA